MPHFRNDKPTIGVLAGWQFYRTATNLSYLAPVFRGISRAAQDMGCNLLLGCGIGPSASPTDPMRPAWPVPLPEADYVPIGPWNTDGIIIANPLRSQVRSAYVQELIAQGYPILFVGSGEEGATIVADNSGGILEAMSHLIQHGHKQIAFIVGTREDMNGDSGERLRAYEESLRIHNLTWDERLVAYGNHVYSGGEQAMRTILNSGAPFTAVLASNDESALGAIKALTEAGRKVPEDVAVIGFDNRLEGAIHKPSLSSIHVPLFNMGYHALEKMLRHLAQGETLDRLSKIDTRLIARDSCGCTPGRQTHLGKKTIEVAHLPAALSVSVLSQAHSLTDEKIQSLCEQLVNDFSISIGNGNGQIFKATLSNILEQTAVVGDDAHIWQEALTILAQQEWKGISKDTLQTILDEVRFLISEQMQYQHRQYVLDERWSSSRLSLLTARLLTALDEVQILEILSEHLKDFDINQAFLVQYVPEGDNPFALSSLRDVLSNKILANRYETQAFPPKGVLEGNEPFILTLIPLVDQSGQLGFMAFGTEHFDLYGAIVQQLGSALNTARLYREATEGRRLAEEANHIKSRFLSTVSHELRNPVGLIIGLSEILLQENEEGDSPLPESAHRDVERIQAYARHLGGLIGDVLDLATSEAGQLRLNMERVDLSDVLRLVAESGAQLAADKGLLWSVNLPEHGPWVIGDRTRLRQVALNFITNAVKFTTVGGVELKLELENDTVKFMVLDTGLGIPLEEQVSIFSEFHRSERSITYGISGLGLGLSICKRLIELHGGTLGLYSSGVEGEGSCFYFTLPVVNSSVDNIQDPVPTFSNRQLVLVLTENVDIPASLREKLNARGVDLQIEKFGNWRSTFRGRQPDLILLDEDSTSKKGWEILRELKSDSQARKLPVFFYTASPKGEAVLRLEYLTKPVEMEELNELLDQLWAVEDPLQPSRTFLLVDDDIHMLDMQSRIIQAQSSWHRVLKAHNGREALNLLQQEHVDLILLDLQMPEMDGFEFLEAMREDERFRSIPVIVVTGKVLAEADMERLNRGVAVVLEKGLFAPEETLEHITSALERKRKLNRDTQRLVRMAMAYMHEHFSEPISRRDVAQYVSIAEDYLTFCFRKELSITPVKYLQRYRVNQAKQLLKNTDKTITDVALSVGFSDSGYFSRIFHREVGLSPEAFRNS
jgi:signal transduction histidine kinase/DNA-binding LacI/PurR family transcriptional regulator/DNA-binding response OmpR family regulator